MKKAFRAGLLFSILLLMLSLAIFFKRGIQSYLLQQARRVVSEFDADLRGPFDFTNREWTLLPPGVYLTGLRTTEAFRRAFHLRLSAAEAYGQLELSLVPRARLRFTGLTAEHPQITLSLEPAGLAQNSPNGAGELWLPVPMTIRGGNLKIGVLKSQYSIENLAGELVLNPDGGLAVRGTGEWGRIPNLQFALLLKDAQTGFDFKMAQRGRFHGSCSLSDARVITLQGQIQVQRMPWTPVRRRLSLQLPASGFLTADLHYAGAPEEATTADLLWAAEIGGALDFRRGIFLKVNLLQSVLEQMSAIPGLSGLLSSALQHPPVQEALKAKQTRYELFRTELTHPVHADKLMLTQILLVTPLYSLQGEGWVLRAGTFSLSGDFILSDYLSEKLLADVKSLRYLRNASNRIVAPVVLRGSEKEAEIRVDLGALADKMLHQSRAALVRKSEEKVTAYFEQEERS